MINQLNTKRIRTISFIISYDVNPKIYLFCKHIFKARTSEYLHVGNNPLICLFLPTFCLLPRLVKFVVNLNGIKQKANEHYYVVFFLLHASFC